MHAFNVPQAAARETEGKAPLAFPAELWAKMAAEQRAACVSADALIQSFGSEKKLGLRDVSVRAGLSIQQALEGLQVLDGMDLVGVEAGDYGPEITLLAVPEDHVRIVGPDGRERWVFVARPVEAPAFDPAELN
jgi:hypothetical protein